MQILNTLATSHDPTEDRLRLVGADRDGGSHLMWMTRRLADQAVVALLRLVEREPAVAEDPRSIGDGASLVRQQEAKAALGAARGAPPPPADHGWLVISLNLSPRPDGVLLTFSGGEHTLAFPLTFVGTRQWLSVLHAGYKAGGWDCAAWPGWFVEAERMARPVTYALH
jgi:hypothetical protein